MKNLTSKVAIVAALLLSAEAKLVPKGCYRSVVPPLNDTGPYDWQSNSHCEGKCKEKGKPVMANWGGSNCLCGDKLPSPDEKIPDKECSSKCDGFPEEICGGPDAYSVFLTGISSDVPIYSSESSSSASSTSTTETPTNTPESTPTDEPESEDGGPNTAAIAAGVVVGVVVLAALIGGAFFFFKYRKRREVVEEYRRNATISSFVAGGKSDASTADSRLEPNLMSQRRQSNGSIADDQDFSRRILKVTNPDSQY